MLAHIQRVLNFWLFVGLFLFVLPLLVVVVSRKPPTIAVTFAAVCVGILHTPAVPYACSPVRPRAMTTTANGSLEATAAAPSVFSGGGRSIAPRLRCGLVPCGCA